MAYYGKFTPSVEHISYATFAKASRYDPLAWIGDIGAGLWRWHQQRKTAQALAELSDHLRADIGLERRPAAGVSAETAARMLRYHLP